MLRDGQWQLTYPPAERWPGAEFTFGTLSTGYFLTEAPEITFGDMRTVDAELPFEDGVRFGEDFRPPPTVTFQVGVDTVAWTSMPHAANLDALGAFRLAWQADAVRTQPGAVAELTANHKGRVRTVYGRPRRWAPASGQFTHLGYTPVVCDFQCAEDRWYGDWRTAQFGVMASRTGGGRFPVTFPLLGLGESEQARLLTVAGNVPTWPVITIQGPTTSPSIELHGLWRLTLLTSLSFGQVVRVDPRPWERTVLRSDGASLAGALASYTPRMRDLQIPPGTWPVVIRGQDLTGTSSITVAWRDAYNYL